MITWNHISAVIYINSEHFDIFIIGFTVIYSEVKARRERKILKPAFSRPHALSLSLGDQQARDMNSPTASSGRGSTRSPQWTSNRSTGKPRCALPPGTVVDCCVFDSDSDSRCRSGADLRSTVYPNDSNSRLSSSKTQQGRLRRAYNTVVRCLSAKPKKLYMPRIFEWCPRIPITLFTVGTDGELTCDSITTLSTNDRSCLRLH